MKRKIITAMLCAALIVSCAFIFGCGEEEIHEKYPAYSFTLVKDASGNSIGLELSVVKAQDLDYSANIVIPSSSYYYKDTEGSSTTDHAEAMAVVSIAVGSFRDNVSLKSVTLPEYLSSISEGCFERCTNLVTVHMGKYVSEIAADAFSGCNELSALDQAGDEKALVGKIGDRAFSTCIKLRTLGFEYASGCTIGDRAFYYDANLPNQDLTKVAYVGAEAFKGCQNTDKYTLPSGASSWNPAWKG